jgi:hypothetical protein
VLWLRPVAQSKAVSEADRAAIEVCARNYIEGYFTADAARMDKALHPELNKVIPVTHRDTGRMFLQKMGSATLIEMTGGNTRTLPESEWGIVFKILDAYENIAMVDLQSSSLYDYLQIAKVNGEWKIVNVLWKVNAKTKTNG